MLNYTAASLDFAELVREVAADHAAWSQATFGSDQERGPIGPLKHLAKEAAEAVEAAESVAGLAAGEVQTEARWRFELELADCLLLLLDASRRAGIKPMGLFRLAGKKMAINKKRAWPKASADEPVEHTKE